MLNNFSKFFLFAFFLLPIILSAEVLINEIMYDLPGADAGREWIEVFNSGIESIDLEGWNLETSANHRPLVLISGSFVLPSGGYALVVQNFEEFSKDHPGFSGTVFRSAFSLKNNFGEVFLKSGDKIIDSISYNSGLGAGGDGSSLQRFNSGWVSSPPTLGQPNKISVTPVVSKLTSKPIGNPEKTTESIVKLKESEEEKIIPANPEQTYPGQVAGAYSEILQSDQNKSGNMLKWLSIALGLSFVSFLGLFLFSKREPNKLRGIKIMVEEEKE